MHRLLALLLFAALAGCATPEPAKPRQYLDEQTAATVTVTADSLGFVNAATRGPDRWRRDRQSWKLREQELDLLEIYGVNVNRMGKHQQYLAVLKWLVPKGAADAPPAIVLRLDDQTLELRDPLRDARKLGMAQPLAESFSANSQWWYFPTDAATLRRIASAGTLSAQLTLTDQQTEYVLAHDRRAELAEFVTGLPK